MDSTSTAVNAWIANAGLNPHRVSRRAGVSQSTMSRVLAGRVDPSLGTLTEIAFACGLELELAVRPSSDPDAARAARSILEENYPDSADAQIMVWQDRLTRYAEDEDPVSLVATAAMHASPLRRRGVMMFTGEVTMGHLASVCDTTLGNCVVSGAAGLFLPDTYDLAPATTILWSENPRHTQQLLTDSALKPTERPDCATIAVLHAEPSLFANSFTQGIVVYAAPLQLMLDCLSQSGGVADAALKEIKSW